MELGVVESGEQLAKDAVERLRLSPIWLLVLCDVQVSRECCDACDMCQCFAMHDA